MSPGGLDRLRTRHMPRSSSLSRHQPSLFSGTLTDSEHGGCHAKPTLTPSAQPVICSSSLLSPAHPLDICQGCPLPLPRRQPSLSSGALDTQPVLCSSGLPPSTPPATPSPLSHHQPSLYLELWTALARRALLGPKDRTLGNTMLPGNLSLWWAGAESGGGGILGSAHVHQQANIGCTA